MLDAQPDIESGRPRAIAASAASAVSTLYGLAVVLFALNVGWVAITGHYTAPNFDDWRILDDLFSTPLLQWIFKDQNGHRIPLTLTLLFVDYTYLGGHMHLLAIASVACTGVGVAVLAGSLRFGDTVHNPMTRSCVGFACFLFCWAAARHDLAWGINQGTLMAAMWSLICMASVGIAIRRKEMGEALGSLPLLGAAGAATAATFSQGAGFSCWAGLLAVSLLCRLPLRVLLAYGMGAAIVLAIYMKGIEIPFFGTPLHNSILAMSTPGRLLEFTLAFIGAPAATLVSSELYHDARTIAVYAGAIGVAGYAAFLLFISIRREPMTPHHVFAIGIPCCALVGGVMVAVNRHFWPASATSDRFTTWSTLFWVGLMFAISAMRQRKNSQPSWPALGGIALLAILSALLVSDLRTVRDNQAAHSSRLIYVSTMHLLGIRWDSVAERARYYDPERADRVVDRIRRDGGSFFNEPRASFPGRSVASGFTRVPDDQCAGAITWSERTHTSDGTVVRLSGWAKELAGGRALEQIVVADRKGIVRGLAVFVHPDANLGGAQLPRQDFPWTGFVGRPTGQPPYHAFGVFKGGTSLCALHPETSSIR